MPEYMTPREAAAAVMVDEATVRRWIRNGMLQAARLPGGQYRIPREAVTRMLEATPQ